MSDMPTLILTRPLEQSEAFAARLLARYPELDVLCAPLMRIQYFDLGQDTDDERDVIFTSVNGVTAWGRSNRSSARKAYCVGPATGDAAKKSGFQVVTGKGAADSLVEVILNDKKCAPLLHIHGVHTRGGIAERLTQAGVQTNGVEAYEQELLPLSESARAVMAGNSPVILPLFSPRSAAHAGTCIADDALIYAVSISQNVADCLPNGWRERDVVAATPSAEAMIQAIGSQLERIKAG